MNNECVRSDKEAGREMRSVFAQAGMTIFERGWLSSNCILFDGGGAEDSVLVDSGYATHAAQTVALVRRALGTRTLARIVNTHLHSDHCGGNLALQSLYGCRIDVPHGDAAKVDAWDVKALTYDATGQQCARFHRTGSFSDGDRLRCGNSEWQVIAVPGHDPESVALYEPILGILISADALWENGFGVVFPELEGEEAFWRVRQTLERLESLNARWIVPGHGAPFCDVDGAFRRAHSRLETFIADPKRHAIHAGKVLIKFHLLEVNSVQVTSLIQWGQQTEYLALIHRRYFWPLRFSDWYMSLITDLESSGALVIRNGQVGNS